MGKALCLLAKGTEEGHEIRLSGRRFSLTLGEPVRFNLLTSTHDTLTNNTAIQNGVMVDVDPDLFAPLPPYITTLEGEGAELQANQKERVEVQLACQLTEVGTLKMECVSAEDDKKRWELEFEVRNKQTDEGEEIQLHPRLNECKELIARLYSGNKKSAEGNEIKTLAKDLEKNSANAMSGTSPHSVNFSILLRKVVSVVVALNNMRKTGFVWLALHCVRALAIQQTLGVLSKFGGCINKIFSSKTIKAGQTGGYSGDVSRAV